MARRRAHFAGTPEEHLVKAGEDGHMAASFSRMSEDFAEKGECKRALTMLTSATEHLGAMHAHSREADKLSRRSLTKAERARRHGIYSTAAAGHHATVKAEETYVRACVLPMDAARRLGFEPPAKLAGARRRRR